MPHTSRPKQLFSLPSLSKLVILIWPTNQILRMTTFLIPDDDNPSLELFMTPAYRTIQGDGLYPSHCRMEEDIMLQRG
ncbi:hypothetical protein RU639_000005 [Aspergillus parasiticus]